jgi:hypothetical protein
MLKRTLIEYSKGYVFRRFEHPTRGVVETLSYPCGRLVYVAEGLSSRKRSRKPRLGPLWRRAAAGGGS